MLNTMGSTKYEPYEPALFRTSALPIGSRAKRAWLAGRLTVKGAIHIDEGAAGALARGKSLLAAGATRVEGAFRRGDPVDIIAPDSRAIARGLAEDRKSTRLNSSQ